MELSLDVSVSGEAVPGESVEASDAETAMMAVPRIWILRAMLVDRLDLRTPRLGAICVPHTEHRVEISSRPKSRWISVAARAPGVRK